MILSPILQVTEAEVAELGAKVAVRVRPARVPRHIRVCTMSNLSADDVTLAIKKWLCVIREFRTLCST